MKYIIYKVKNLINNKIYVGAHQTKDINDKYMGSGSLIKRAINKYGIKNFKKSIFFVFDNKNEMYLKESEIVTEKFVKKNITYNQKVGGFDHLNTGTEKNIKRAREGGIICSQNNLKKIQEKMIKEPSFKKEYINHMRKIGKNTFLGKKHSEKTKTIIGQKNSIKQAGENNSQFGTIWVYNKELSLFKKIKKEEFEVFEKDGWVRGRKI